MASKTSTNTNIVRPSVPRVDLTATHYTPLSRSSTYPLIAPHIVVNEDGQIDPESAMRQRWMDKEGKREKQRHIA